MTFKVKFTVTNTGNADGDEVPQLYITDMVASTVRPQKQLRAFDRVSIPAGKSAEVEFILDKDDFMMYGPDMKPVVEPGDFRIAIGASSRDIRLEDTITVE